jgi:hypothetical protein
MWNQDFFLKFEEILIKNNHVYKVKQYMALTICSACTELPEDSAS